MNFSSSANMLGFCSDSHIYDLKHKLLFLFKGVAWLRNCYVEYYNAAASAPVSALKISVHKVSVHMLIFFDHNFLCYLCLLL